MVHSCVESSYIASVVALGFGISDLGQPRNGSGGGARGSNFRV